MLIAVRARRLIPLAAEGPTRDPRELFSPPRVLDDHVVVIRGVFAPGFPAPDALAPSPATSDTPATTTPPPNAACTERNRAASVLSGIRGGIIEAVEPVSVFRRRAGVPLADLGDVTLVPGVINCHTHLELSHLEGRTARGGGFVPWVKSLLALVGAGVTDAERAVAVARAASQLAACHTAHAGDVTAVAPATVRSALRAAGIGCTHFAEVFGYRFTAQGGGPALPTDVAALWPAAMRDLAPDTEALTEGARNAASVPGTAAPHPDAALAGHALYSTHPVALAAARRWCERNQRVFSMHLAEHPDEEEFLSTGCGALADLLAVRVLPQGFAAPGMRPVPYAAELGLLDEGTLAVHCVQVNAHDIRLLAESGAHVCLCPRSNAIIGTGEAPARKLAEAGVPLCCGTDSLASNDDLDLWNEARALRDLPEGRDLPAAALLRMLASHGAAAIGRNDTGAIAPGRRARLALLPPDFSEATGTTP